MTPEMKSLKKSINDLLESNLWKDIKPTSEIQQRVNEYILQAQGDLKRCDGNLDRAWKAMEDIAEEIKDEPSNTPSDDTFIGD